MPRNSVLCFAIASTLAGGTAAARADYPDGSLAPRQELRCNPLGQRVVEPLVVEEGGTLDVAVDFNYTCPDGSRQLLFYLVVENSDQIEPSGRTGRMLIANVREGLTDFVEEVDFDNGTQGGLILYSSAASTRVNLQGGSSGRQALLTAVGGIASSSASARAAAEAINAAIDGLLAAEGDDETVRAIVILDAGANLGDPTAVLGACERARDAGFLVGVMSLESASARLQECAEEVLYKGSGRDNGNDLPERLTDLGQGVARGNQAEGVTVLDKMQSGMSYVEDSGVPAPSFVFGSETMWEFAPPPPAGGEQLAYQVRARDVGPDQTISEVAQLTLVYVDGSTGSVELDNPTVCVFPVGRPEVCDDFVATLTPPAPSETPSPTVEVTEVPEPTATESTPTYRIYMPLTRTR